jgi:hypothetical protein
MTTDEIRALPAGRELDALVARRVMGWRRAGNRLDGYFWQTVRGPSGYAAGRLTGLYLRPWNPSADIAAAWEVKEAMRLRGDGYAWHVYVASIARVWGETAEEAALLLSREAVAAVAAEEERHARQDAR